MSGSAESSGLRALVWTTLTARPSGSLVRLPQSLEGAHRGGTTWRDGSIHRKPLVPRDTAHSATDQRQGYAEMVFPRYPQLNTLISQLSRNDDQLGPYWQPGRRIVEGLLDAVPFPTKPAPPPSVTLAGHQFVTARVAEPALQHVAGPIDAETWRPESAIRLKEIDGAPWLMTKRFDISALEGYLRTWSSLHAFHELHPEDAARKGRGGEDGDIVDRAMGRIRRGLADAGHQDKQIEVGWPLILMMIQKRL